MDRDARRTPKETAARWMSDHAHRQATLRVILAASIVSTALHFTHNFVAVDRYPQSDLISSEGVRVAILASWPLLTAIGLLGYRLYSRRRYPAAHACLTLYSLTGIATLGHFLDGSPNIPAFWYATIFTDGLAGFTMLGFVITSARSARSPQPARA